MKLIIYTDGGARGNPGPAAAGVVIKNEDGKILAEFGKYLGETTNNQAEYQALILALEKAKEMACLPERQGGTEIQCFADSELMVKQLNHQYKVRDADLAPLFLKVWNLSTAFKKISFQHIPRERNKEADKQVNDTLDKR